MIKPLYGMLASIPKDRVDPKLVHFVDQDHEIVAQHLGQRLIDLGRLALAPQRVAKLPLDHAEGALDIRPLVVVGEKEAEAVIQITISKGTIAREPS